MKEEWQIIKSTTILVTERSEGSEIRYLDFSNKDKHMGTHVQTMHAKIALGVGNHR